MSLSDTKKIFYCSCCDDNVVKIKCLKKAIKEFRNKIKDPSGDIDIRSVIYILKEVFGDELTK